MGVTGQGSIGTQCYSVRKSGEAASPAWLTETGQTRGNEGLGERPTQGTSKVRQRPWEEGPCQEADRACVYWAQMVEGDASQTSCWHW